jgi:hypothetical protein
VDLTYDIVYESCPWHKRVSLFNEHKKLLSLHQDFENNLYKEGAVIVGRIRTITQGLNAAFVDIGDIDDGFLPLNKIPKDMGHVCEGQAIVVRVVRERVEGKGATLNANVLHNMPEGTLSLPMVLEGPPVALSRALMNAGASPVRVWINDARFRVEALKFIPETKVFQLDQHEDVDLLDKLDDELSLLSGEEFPLLGGGCITIEPTKALTTIDVDSGSMTMGSKEDLAFQVNMLASEEIVRLCGILNIGGSVIVDFISLRDGSRRTQVAAHLRDLFAARDHRKVEVLKMSRFGLLEFNREKTGTTLLKTLQKPDVIASDILLKLWRAKPGSKIFRVEASVDVVDILKAKLTASAAIAYLGRPVEIISKGEFSSDRYAISSNDIL